MYPPLEPFWYTSLNIAIEPVPQDTTEPQTVTVVGVLVEIPIDRGTICSELINEFSLNPEGEV